MKILTVIAEELKNYAIEHDAKWRVTIITNQRCHIQRDRTKGNWDDDSFIIEITNGEIEIWDPADDYGGTPRGKFFSLAEPNSIEKLIQFINTAPAGSIRHL